MIAYDEVVKRIEEKIKEKLLDTSNKRDDEMFSSEDWEKFCEEMGLEGGPDVDLGKPTDYISYLE